MRENGPGALRVRPMTRRKPPTTIIWRDRSFHFRKTGTPHTDRVEISGFAPVGLAAPARRGLLAVAPSPAATAIFFNQRLRRPASAITVPGRGFICAQVRKNANQTRPRISIASPVETVRRASTDGPGSAWRASVGVSTIWRCCLVAMGTLKLAEWRDRLATSRVESNA